MHRSTWLVVLGMLGLLACDVYVLRETAFALILIRYLAFGCFCSGLVFSVHRDGEYRARQDYYKGYRQGQIAGALKCTSEDSLQAHAQFDLGCPTPLHLVPQGVWTVLTVVPEGDDLLVLLQRGANLSSGDLRLARVSAEKNELVLAVIECSSVVRLDVSGETVSARTFARMSR